VGSKLFCLPNTALIRKAVSFSAFGLRSHLTQAVVLPPEHSRTCVTFFALLPHVETIASTERTAKRPLGAQQLVAMKLDATILR
jgi:hypothetical protein